MRKSLGFVIALYAISVLLNDAFDGFEEATVATLQTIETAAQISELQIIKQAD